MNKKILLKDNLNQLDVLGKKINIIEAKTHGATKLGLLNHRFLSECEGIFFVKKKLFHTFGMRFPICVLAFDTNKKLISQPTTVEPNSVFLCPKKSNFVIEISATHNQIKNEFNSKNQIYVFNHFKSKLIFNFFKVLPALIIAFTLLFMVFNAFAMDTMNLTIGKIRTFDLENPPQSIQIDDPEIIEIERIGLSNSIKIIPKQSGKTTLTFTYLEGEDDVIHINVTGFTNDFPSVSQIIEEQNKTNQYLILTKTEQLKKNQIHYSVNAGKIFVFGKIDTIQKFREISKIITPHPEVFFPGFEINSDIIGQVIDLLNTDLKIMGFDNINVIQNSEKLLLKGVHKSAANKERAWIYVAALLPNIIDATTSFFGDSKLVQINIDFFEVGKLNKKEIGLQYPTFGKSGFGIHLNSEKPIFQITPFSVLFHALEGKNYVREIARPVLITRSGEKATFLAGGEVPIQTVTSSSSSTNVSVTFKSVGIMFDVTPRVNDDGTIWIALNIEYSQINEKLSYQNTPGFNSRKVNTNVILREGSAAVISGLIQNSDIKQMEGIPLLRSLPILGSLFERNTHKQDTTELWIALSAVHKNNDDLNSKTPYEKSNQHKIKSLYESIL